MAYNVFSRQQWKLINERGFSPDAARRIAYKQQKKLGNLVPGTFRLSAEGNAYSQFTPDERAIIRRARSTGRKPSEYYIEDGKVKLKPFFRKIKIK